MKSNKFQLLPVVDRLFLGVRGGRVSIRSFIEKLPSTAPSKRWVVVGLFVLGMPVGVSMAAVDPKAGRYYEDALTRFNQSDMPGAIIQLKNAIQIDPRMLSAQLLLGKALLSNAEVAAAEVAFMEALSLGVNRSEVVIPLSTALIGQGKPKSLFDRPELSISGLPPRIQFQLHLVRAGAYSDLGNPRDALKSVEDARKIDSTSPASWTAEVPLRIRARQFREAMLAAERAIALAPESAEAWNQKGSVLHASGDISGALKAYDVALAKAEGLDDARIARAGIFLDLNQIKDAQADLDHLRKKSPREPRAAYLRALLAERNGDVPGAKAALADVTGFLDPVPIDYIRYRPQLLMLNGLSHFAQGNNDKAKGYLEVLQSSNALPAAKVLAQIYLDERNPSRAQTILEGYVRANPRDSRALMLLASAHLAAGRSHRATTLMEEALTIDDSAKVRAALGQSLLSGGRTEDAVVQLEKAFKADQGQTQSGFILVGLYIRGGQPAKALTVAEAVAKRSPDSAVSFNLLGIAKNAVKDHAGARTAFERALKLDPGLTAARLNLARLEIDRKEFQKADQRLREVLKEHDGHVETLLVAATLAARQGRSEDELRALEKARDAEGPKRVAAALKLVEFHTRRKQAGMALEAAKFAHSKAPEDFETLVAYAKAKLAANDVTGGRIALKDAGRVAENDADRLLGVALLQNLAGDAGGALYTLDKALSAQPGFLAAEALLVEVELRQGDVAKAERRAAGITAREPRRAIGFSLLGDVFSAKAQPAAAVDAYRKAHQIEPSGETMLRLFTAMSRNGDEKNALVLAEQWVKAQPGDVDVRRALADGYARARNYPVAKKVYEEILRVRPRDVNVLNNLANVQIHLKDVGGAQKSAEAALAIDSGNASVIDTLGWVMYLLENYERALGYLRDARLRAPSDPVIRYHLGATLARIGRKAEATAELEASLSASQNFDEKDAARHLLSSLR